MKVGFALQIINSIEVYRCSQVWWRRLLVGAKDALHGASKYTMRAAWHVVAVRDHVHVARVLRMPTPEMYRISFCITCMDRLHHLRQTLPQNIRDNADYENVEFVVLDYNSSDGLDEWLRTSYADEIASGKIVYRRTSTPTVFEMSRAKNMAHTCASGDIVCNLDADNFTGRSFARYINAVIHRFGPVIASTKRRNYYLHARQDWGSGGRMFLMKEDFHTLGGFDERCRGYGWEDDDLYRRARRFGRAVLDIPFPFLQNIPHGDDERGARLDDVDIARNNERNKAQVEKNDAAGVTVIPQTLRYPEIEKGASVPTEPEVSPPPAGLRIPQIIHQSWKDDSVPDHVYLPRWRRSWRMLQPRWRLYFWTDVDNEQFIRDRYPWFLSTYRSLPYPINRADAVRYLYLHYYGGVYVDLDCECLRPITPLLAGAGVVLGSRSSWDRIDAIPNAFMASVVGHPLWLEVVDEIRRRSAERGWRVEDLTGPGVLTTVVRRFSPAEGIRIVSPRHLYPLEWKTHSVHESTIDAELTRRPHDHFPSAYMVTYWTHNW